MELLKDPGNTRVFKGTVQVGLLKDFLKREGRMHNEDYCKIIREATQLFSKQMAIKNLNQI
jgi:hypothetical protein